MGRELGCFVIIELCVLGESFDFFGFEGSIFVIRFVLVRKVLEVFWRRVVGFKG